MDPKPYSLNPVLYSYRVSGGCLKALWCLTSCMRLCMGLFNEGGRNGIAIADPKPLNPSPKALNVQGSGYAAP